MADSRSWCYLEESGLAANADRVDAVLIKTTWQQTSELENANRLTPNAKFSQRVVIKESFNAQSDTPVSGIALMSIVYKQS